MRGRKGTRVKHLRQAGWELVSEHNEPGRRHELVLRHVHGLRNPHPPHDPRGAEVRIVAPTRPQAYVRAERELVEKKGRTVRARIPD